MKGLKGMMTRGIVVLFILAQSTSLVLAQQVQKVRNQKPLSPQSQKVPIYKIEKHPLLKLPDLAVSITCPSKVYPGEELDGNIKVVVKNVGTAPAKDFFVDLVLSSNAVIPLKFASYSSHFSDDILLKGGREHIKSLAPGASIKLILHGSNKIPDDTPPGYKYLGIVVDPGNNVKEISEKNNIDLCRIKVALCPPIAGITSCHIVEASGGTAGFARLRLSWTYASTGEKPYRLLITVYRLQAGSWDNIMPSNRPFGVISPAHTTTADVTIFRLFSGDYRIVFKAFYSCNREREYTFEKHI